MKVKLEKKMSKTQKNSNARFETCMVVLFVCIENKDDDMQCHRSCRNRKIFKGANMSK